LVKVKHLNATYTVFGDVG